jgi:hypothetical protein
VGAQAGDQLPAISVVLALAHTEVGNDSRTLLCASGAARLNQARIIRSSDAPPPKAI